MPITFIPRRGTILMCQFGSARVPPEMEKLRRAIVVSVKDANHRHADAPGVCAVVPLSGTSARTPQPWDVFIPKGRYRSITIDVWAKCSMVTNVSHTRLDRVLGSGGYKTEDLMTEDMHAIEEALKQALGL